MTNTITIPLSEIYIGTIDWLPSHEDVLEGKGVELDTHGVPTDPAWCHLGATCGEGEWELNYEEVALEIEDSVIYHDNSSLIITVPISHLIRERFDRVLSALFADVYGTGGYWGGSAGSGKTEPEFYSILFVPKSGVYEQFLMYRGVSSESSFSKNDATIYTMTMRGFMCLERSEGDQSGHAFFRRTTMTDKEKMTNNDTREHIMNVQRLLSSVITDFVERSVKHDASKLVNPELETFTRVTDRLNGLTYGSDEYKACLKDMGPALKHHYANNSHHPEYWDPIPSGEKVYEYHCESCANIYILLLSDQSECIYCGQEVMNITERTFFTESRVTSMTLMDVIEMLLDWKAASLRHADGDIYKSLEINKGRFELSQQLVEIMRNTIDYFGLGSTERGKKMIKGSPSR